MAFVRVNEVPITSYFYSWSYELLFAYELWVTGYFTSYELIFNYEL